MMAIGPVQLIVLGFNHPHFHGEIISELERLRESDTIRVIDSLAVYKDADGELEVEHLSNLTEQEAIELGSKIGASSAWASRAKKGPKPARPPAPSRRRPRASTCSATPTNGTCWKTSRTTQRRRSS